MKLTPLKIAIIQLLFLFSSTGFTQALLADIDFNRIPQKKIRHFIDSQIENHNLRFSDIEPSYHQDAEISHSGYSLVEDAFIVKEDLENVWDSYCSTEMAKSWNGKKISFGLLLSKWSDYVMYCSDQFCTAIDTGQVFFVNLKLLRGIYNLAVGFEIINIDSRNKTVQFSYVKGGKTEGVQTIRFYNTVEGFTKILHTSEFRSNSRFRDKRLYPRIHRKLVIEFHKNMLFNIGKTKDDLDYL